MPIRAVTPDPSIARVHLGVSPIALLPMAQGGSVYGTNADEGERTDALQASYEAGLRHFDTAAGYDRGRSEERLGTFLKGKRDTVFLASKASVDELSAAAIVQKVDESLARLGVDHIDLYYIHWPRAGRDLRPVMEGLEQARRDGKIGAIGVSNFDVAQMAQVAEVAPIAAHQLGFSLLWRHREADVMAYCRTNNIALVAYSALSHGILSGKFEREHGIPAGDQRHTILPFRPDIWPSVYEAVEELKVLGTEAGISLPTLAIRWIVARPEINSVVVGARNHAQAEANALTLEPPIDDTVLARATAISDRINALIPDAGNLFNHYP